MVAPEISFGSAHIDVISLAHIDQDGDDKAPSKPSCLYFSFFPFPVSSHDKGVRKYIWSTIVVILYTDSTFHMGTGWGGFINAVIKFGGTPDLPSSLALAPAWVEASASALYSLNILIADLIFVSEYTLKPYYF